MEVFVPLYGGCSGLDFVWCPSEQPHLTCAVTFAVVGQRVPKESGILDLRAFL